MSAFPTLFLGYGRTVPQTNMGKVLLIVYSLLGIPLIQMTTTYLSKGWISLVTAVIQFCGNCHQKISAPIKTIVTCACLLYVLFMSVSIAAAITTHPKAWNFLDSFYFWWVTVTTIGFGDFVTPNHVYEETGILVFVSMFYVLMTFGLIAGCIQSATDSVSAAKENDLKLSETAKYFFLKLSNSMFKRGSDHNNSSNEEKHPLNRSARLHSRTKLLGSPKENEGKQLLPTPV